MATEPVVTWNLILCALAFPIVIWVIKDSAKKSSDIQNIRFQNICDIIKTIRDDAREDRQELVKAKEDLWDGLKFHDHKIDCDRADCTATETNGYIPVQRHERRP
jgi:hypothetical protein